MTRYTIGQLAGLACVSTRTLRHYDQLGLLRPTARGENGYRLYDEADALRLQQIMFYRELGLRLEVIGAVLDDPGFDTLAALQRHRRALQARAARLGELLATVDRTIEQLHAGGIMKTEELFEGFDDATQREYEREANQRWGEARVRDSRRRWDAYGPSQQAEIMAEGAANAAALVPYIGQDPAQPAVQALVARWHQHLRHFYEPDLCTLRGLGEMYAQDERFSAYYERIAPGLAAFFSEAIAVYVGKSGE
jgi:DNA-binding transcriptional MerR regulator